MKTILFIIIIAISLTSCNDEKDKTLGVACQLEVISSLKPDTLLFDEHRTIFLETNDNSLLSNVDKIIEWNNVFYVLDRRMKQVVLFDSDGKYIDKIHRVGNGPGEYADLFDMTLDKDKGELLLLATPSSLHSYSLEGRYIGSRSLAGYYSSVSVIGESVCLENTTYVNNKLSDASITILRGKDTIELLEPLDEIAPYCTSRGYSLNETGLFTRKFDNVIYRLDESAVCSKYFIDFGVENFPKESKDKVYDCRELSEYARNNSLVYSMTDLLETEQKILFRTNLFEGFYLLDKDIKKVWHYCKILNTDYNLPLHGYLPVYGIENRVCFVNMAASLCSMKKLFEDNPLLKEKMSPSLVSLLQNIEEESNPVLFFYRIK